MDSLTLKIDALAWLRFTKRMPYICTESGHWNSDVIGCDNDVSVEIEVKVSGADLRREFTSKTHKHSYYRSCAGGNNCPTYFYLYVPKVLEKVAIALIEKHQPKAGLITYDDGAEELSYRDGKRSTVVRKPKKLHEERPSESFKRDLLLRMGSELIARHVAWKKFKTQFSDTLQEASSKISEEVKKSLESHNLEETDDPNSEDSKADGSIT